MKNFKKSSFCEKGKCCIEVAVDKDMVFIRNSKNPATVIQYTLQEWKDFIKGVKSNEFDMDLWP